MSVIPAMDDDGIGGLTLWAGVAVFSFWLAVRLERLNDFGAYDPNDRSTGVPNV